MSKTEVDIQIAFFIVPSTPSVAKY